MNYCLLSLIYYMNKYNFKKLYSLLFEKYLKIK